MTHARKRHLAALLAVWLAHGESASGQVPVVTTPGAPPIASLGAPRVIAVSTPQRESGPFLQPLQAEPTRLDQGLMPTAMNTTTGPILVQHPPVGILAQPGSSVAMFVSDAQARPAQQPPVAQPVPAAAAAPTLLPMPRSVPMAMPSPAMSQQSIQSLPLGTIVTPGLGGLPPGTIVSPSNTIITSPSGSQGRISPVAPGGTVIETMPGEIIIDSGDGMATGGTWLQQLRARSLRGTAFQTNEFSDPLKPHLDRYKFYASFEYLSWALTGNQTPVLVTGSSNLTSPNSGALGQPGTQTLYGGQGSDLSTGMNSGGRVKIGMWWNRAQDIATEFTFFGMGSNSTEAAFQSFGNPSTGYPVMGRPFVNALTGNQSVEFVGVPAALNGGNGLAGSVIVQDQTQFYGGDLNAKFGLHRGCFWTIDGLAGVRNLNLRDNLSITEILSETSGGGGSFRVNDSFSSQNTFWGGQLGMVFGLNYRRWALDTTVKVALGQTNVNADISGYTQINAPGSSQTLPGGLLAQSSNIGGFTDNHFSVVPELGLTLGYYITPKLKVFAGYNVLYWTNVARSGGLIDASVNPNLIPPASGSALPARPAQQVQFTDLWAQGVNVGLELRY